MSYCGVIVALDLASTTGVADGEVGTTPIFWDERLSRAGDDYHDIFGRTARLVARLVAGERLIAGRTYAFNEAAKAGLVRVVIEAPILRADVGSESARTLLQGIWAAAAGVAVANGVRTVRVSPSTVRHHFLGPGIHRRATVKHDVRRVCNERLGWEVPSLDCADAAALWHWASSMWNPDRTPSLYQRVLPGTLRGA